MAEIIKDFGFAKKHSRDPYHYELVFDTILIPRITTDRNEVN